MLSTHSSLFQSRAQQSETRPSEPEHVIGFVLLDKKKFRCAKDECKDLTYGRLADLRRHYDQAHSRNRAQYFCPYPRCSRSHAPGGGRGRSFGTRKDKRDEHVKNVHEKTGKSNH
ncbi:hypothetical protein BDV95DRAFT_483371 [Massariosphaeria phaeospora]|uniref:C2H2-type domain-containing protein n=1 Tax=Massariosphaeria phaeospora TaxID=100035 RepID=A0A7C8MBY8_9PLEO|nr:hypothetical protein BDV95DRAFT_483371 [Massariosphaeria phaeospora]